MQSYTHRSRGSLRPLFSSKYDLTIVLYDECTAAQSRGYAPGKVLSQPDIAEEDSQFSFAKTGSERKPAMNECFKPHCSPAGASNFKERPTY
ncbi:hypothetical protein PsYK624_042830 [Phanerochaete sordida]|uniref:Uncharacterized protein n=1 Tax=Phanerochaete sordida TaxID=48140 RepID=A0A9P3G614_9APHY|nr:hypothetical protein PsYK624_042830 [Phanerochaete sordida]